MKNIFSLFLTVLIASQLNQSVAQDSTSTSDELKPLDQDLDRKRQDFAYFDFNWDRLLNLEGGVEQKWFGRGVSFGGMYDLAFNEGGNFSLGVGLGFTSNNYYTNARISTFDSAGVSYSRFEVVGDTLRRRGKLSLNYVELPIEFRFRTKENDRGHRWKLAVGAKVGYLVQSHEKFFDGNDDKIKLYDYPNFTELRYGLTGRVGYGSVMISAFYGLTPLFESTTSSNNINQLSIGISIIPY